MWRDLPKLLAFVAFLISPETKETKATYVLALELNLAVLAVRQRYTLHDAL